MTRGVAHYLCYVLHCWNPGTRVVQAVGVLGCIDHSDDEVIAAVEWVEQALAESRRADARR